MIEDKDQSDGDGMPPAANGTGERTTGKEDPRILRIAAAIGRKLARDDIKQLRAANDNKLGGRIDPPKPTR